VYTSNDIVFRVRPQIDNDQLNRLHAEGFEHHVLDHDWQPQLEHSLLWVGAFDGDRLVGFVNIAWDGGVHAFLLDTAVEVPYRRRGIGTRLVREALEAARRHGGLEWVHVDSDDVLMRDFYGPAGFSPVPAGTVRVADPLPELGSTPP
jgi:ribosomal protein S18 acetylase RimI-like enzyme